ncbi:MAG: DUF1566 domain-containing protein [Litorivicinaceae bacterium]|nr:MAG: DUF1566 domain-containing protein [Litorivicinaceae bacterium]CAI8410322.1 MAG: Uncharacterised protein [Gammaproteobacteria bacterium]
MRILVACITLLLLTSCDRSTELPDCVDAKSPKDYGKFIVNPTTGLAQHVSGSVWYRCMAGQSFRGKKCLGQPLELTKAEADSYLRDFSHKTGERWRLPTKNEFKEILETSCDNPPLNPNVFPMIEVKNFWLSDKPWLQNASFACAIFLFQGSISCRQAIQLQQPILMVRD